MRRGCSEAWTEITLSGGPGQRDMVVRREIKQVRRDDNSMGYSSSWKLNGGAGRGLSSGGKNGACAVHATAQTRRRPAGAAPGSRRALCEVPSGWLPVGERRTAPLPKPRRHALHLPGVEKRADEVKELIAELNIQFDNLCQVWAGRGQMGGAGSMLDGKGMRPLDHLGGWCPRMARVHDACLRRCTAAGRRATSCAARPVPPRPPPQFLPQDRVASFAHMDPYELLAATQKAIGDSTLYDQHQQLISRREELRAQSTVRARFGCALVGAGGGPKATSAHGRREWRCAPRAAACRACLRLSHARWGGSSSISRCATLHTQSLTNHQRQLERLEAENRALERDAERFRRRQTLQRQIKDIRTKAGARA